MRIFKSKRFISVFFICSFIFFFLSVLSLADGKNVRFIAVGDVGHNINGQREVAKMMSEKAKKEPVQFVILLGDLFAGFGVKSADDPLLEKKFEKMYDFSSLDVPFFGVLGNHDHYGSVSALVEYSKKNSKWKMPKPFYTFISSNVQFFMIDTQTLLYQKEEGEKHLHWLEERLKQSQSKWKVVCGHHTVFSYGYHKDNKKLIDILVPLFKKYGVSLYLCGHGHAMELIEKKDHLTLYVVSSTGSVTRSVEKGPDTRYCSSKLGFSVFDFSDSTCSVAFWSKRNSADFMHVLKLPVSPVINRNAIHSLPALH